MQKAAALVQSLRMYAIINDFAIRNARTPDRARVGREGRDRCGEVSGNGGGPDELGVMDNDAVQAALQRSARQGCTVTRMEFQKFLGGTPSTLNDIKVNQPFQHKANVARVLADAQASFYDNWRPQVTTAWPGRTNALE